MLLQLNLILELTNICFYERGTILTSVKDISRTSPVGKNTTLGGLKMAPLPLSPSVKFPL